MLELMNAKQQELRELLEFTKTIAFEAGQLTLGYFGRSIDTDFKRDDSPVTIADKEAEALMRERIEASYPQHGVLGEEFGESNSGASHRWIIDPIDGTKSFMRGVPLYGVLVGLEIDGRIEAGAAYFPALNELVYAATNEGCYLNGRRCFVSQTQDLNRAFVSFTDVQSFTKYNRTEAWERVKAATYYRVGWSDAYGHMLVATGRLDIMLDPIMNPWDCGPFPVLLREAGGYFGDWSGEEDIYANEALSTTKTLLPEVLTLLNSDLKQDR